METQRTPETTYTHPAVSTGWAVVLFALCAIAGIVVDMTSRDLAAWYILDAVGPWAIVAVAGYSLTAYFRA